MCKKNPLYRASKCRSSRAPAPNGCCGPRTVANRPSCDAAAPPRPELLRRGLRLEYFTVGRNIIEGVVSVTAALAPGSVALLGFGIDSFVQTTSGLILIWRLGAEHGAQGHAPEPASEIVKRRCAGVPCVQTSSVAGAGADRPSGGSASGGVSGRGKSAALFGGSCSAMPLQVSGNAVSVWLPSFDGKIGGAHVRARRARRGALRSRPPPPIH